MKIKSVVELIDGFEVMSPHATTWGLDKDFLGELIGLCGDVKTIIEVGTFHGGSAFDFLKLCAQANIYCVDTWLGSVEFYVSDSPAYVKLREELPFKNGYPRIYHQFLSNVIFEGFEFRVFPIPLPSNCGAKVLAHEKVVADFIYIDGSHEYEDVKRDLVSYWPLLKAGGVMAGDDYNDEWPGVKQAVAEFANEIGKPFASNSRHFGFRK